MTEAAFISFVKSALRSKSRFWPPISNTIRKARTRRGFYLCNGCGQEVPKSTVVNNKRVNNVHCDHVKPVVDTVEGFTGWDDYVTRLFSEEDNFQILCYNCHTNVKSKEEREERKTISSLREDHEGEYQTWSNMNDRCLNPKATGYYYYGGKGVTVCDNWKRDGTVTPFLNFLLDMGCRPEGKTLDRIDYTKDYNPQNCRWATYQEQARNTSANNWLEYNGELKVLQEWGETLGIKPNSILTRLRRGWSVAQALEFEVRSKPDYSGRLTQEDFLAISEGLSHGKTVRQIAEDLEMDESQVSRITSKFSLGHPPSGKTYEMGGEYLTLPAWSARFNIKYETLVYRLKTGKTLQEALTTPVRDVSGKSQQERASRPNKKKDDNEKTV